MEAEQRERKYIPACEILQQRNRKIHKRRSGKGWRELVCVLRRESGDVWLILKGIYVNQDITKWVNGAKIQMLMTIGKIQ